MKPIVLILEDNILLAFDLADMVRDELAGEPVVVSSVAAALEIEPESLAFAFLDINVVDGKTYPVARSLIKNGIPFIFVSANERSTLPLDLRNSPSCLKPAERAPLVLQTKALSGAFN